MSVTRTTIFGDSRIINNFKNVCKAQGRIPSKVIVGFMSDVVNAAKNVERWAKRRERRTKQAARK